ncbi:MAG: haloalkane dehalogenase [Bacteroidota bacterium]
MEYLRTPDERFIDLEGYDFQPRYVQVSNGLRMHFIDVGPSNGQPVLLLHGEPSWSYLYRKMIPVLVEAGYRAIAPDLIGFGKSDKPSKIENYSYGAHQQWMLDFLHEIDLKDACLFCQDWGGLLGLRVAIDEEDRFASVVVANTFLPAGNLPPNPAFEQWKAFSQTVPVFPVGGVINMGTVNDLAEEVIAAYNAPFPDESYKAGARIFPNLVPMTSDDPEAIKNKEYLLAWAQWKKPLLTLFSDSDPIMNGGEKIFQQMVPGAKDQDHEIIRKAGHFLQEDQGAVIAQKVVAFLNKLK